MKERELEVFSKSVFLLGMGVVVLLTSIFLFCNLMGELNYNKAISLEEPKFKEAKKDYYEKVFSFLNKAIFFNSLNSRYYIEKADFLLKSEEEGLLNSLGLKTSEAEFLYKEAVRLNPLSFVEHIKLGWYYRKNNPSLAEEELLKAVELYPKDYQPYFYLSLYYFIQKKEIAGFKNFLIAYYYHARRFSKERIKELISCLSNNPHIYYNPKRRQLQYIYNTQRDRVFFEDLFFPEVKVPIRIEVFLQNSQVEVLLLAKKGNFSQSFLKKVMKNNVFYYTFLREYPSHLSLKDLYIETNPFFPLQKIVFIINI